MDPNALLTLRLQHRERAWRGLLEGKRRSWRKWIGSLHPILFGKVYFPQWMPKSTPAFHWTITNGYMRNTRYAVAAPVGSAKTTMLTKIGSLWSAFCESISEILIVTSAGKLAGMWLEQMGHALEMSRELVEDYGAFNGIHWGSEHLELTFPERRCFIRGIGWGEATRGRRPDRILVDDPQDEANLKSHLQREEFRDWIRGPLIGRLNDESKKLTYIGTAVTEEALICELINTPWAGWVSDAFAMLDEESGASLWPEQFPVEMLMRRREEIGEDAFQQEYQNNPVRMKLGKPFTLARLQYGRIPLDPTHRLTICVDPAFRVGGDAWGITVVEWLDDGRWHLREEYKEQTGLEPMLGCLVMLRRKYRRIDAVGLETAGQQVSLEYLIRELEAKHRGISFPMVFLKHARNTGSKDNRIMALAQLVNRGDLIVAEGLDQTVAEMREWKIGRGASHQDDHLIDSLAGHMEIGAPQRPKEPKAFTEEDRIRARYDQITAWKKHHPEKRGDEVPDWWAHV